MNKALTGIFALLLLCSCSTFEMHIKEGTSPAAPSLIFIDNFAVRDINFNPHIAEEFSSALHFEFFKMGYTSMGYVKKEKGISSQKPEDVADLCREYGADYFITGVISRRETGFLTERKAATGILFQVYSGSGVLLSEGYFSDADSPDIYVSVRRGARKFAGELAAGLWGR
jgi:hypothetical protein